MPLQCLWSVLHVNGSVLFVAVYLRLSCLETLLLLLLSLLVLATVWLILLYLIIGHCTLHAIHLLLLFSWHRRIWSWFVYTRSWNDTLYFHHGVKLLSCLLKLLFIGSIVRIWTNSWHSVSSCFMSHHATYNTRLILNFYVNWIIWVNWSSVRHWSLRARSRLVSICLGLVHLSSRLQNLIVLRHWNSTTAVHGIIHHTTFV